MVHLNIESSISNTLEYFECESKTSINVIMKVLNVPLCAVKSLLRDYGVSTDNLDETSICIDEKMLEYFADAYVRKLKNYFASSSRHISSISDKERQDLKEFYNLFKKKEVSNEQLGNWEDIDISLLRDSFHRKVWKLTWDPCRILDILFKNLKSSEKEVSRISFKTKDEFLNTEGVKNAERDRISSTILLYANSTYAIRLKQKPYYNFLSIYIGRHKMLSSARYYVFSDDDDHIN